MSTSRLPIFFVVATVAIDAMGIGLIMPVMPDLLREVDGGNLSEAAVWGGHPRHHICRDAIPVRPHHRLT